MHSCRVDAYRVFNLLKKSQQHFLNPLISVLYNLLGIEESSDQSAFGGVSLHQFITLVGGCWCLLLISDRGDDECPFTLLVSCLLTFICKMPLQFLSFLCYFKNKQLMEYFIFWIGNICVYITFCVPFKLYIIGSDSFVKPLLISK